MFNDSSDTWKGGGGGVWKNSDGICSIEISGHLFGHFQVESNLDVYIVNRLALGTFFIFLINCNQWLDEVYYMYMKCGGVLIVSYVSVKHLFSSKKVFCDLMMESCNKHEALVSSFMGLCKSCWVI